MSMVNMVLVLTFQAAGPGGLIGVLKSGSIRSLEIRLLRDLEVGFIEAFY